MAQLDRNVRIYHTTHPTGEQLIGLQAPRWPDAYALAASFPDPGLSPEETLRMAFDRTQQDHPLIHTVSWQPGARRRSTSPKILRSQKWRIIAICNIVEMLYDYKRLMSINIECWSTPCLRKTA